MCACVCVCVWQGRECFLTFSGWTYQNALRIFMMEFIYSFPIIFSSCLVSGKPNLISWKVVSPFQFLWRACVWCILIIGCRIHQWSQPVLEFPYISEYKFSLFDRYKPIQVICFFNWVRFGNLCWIILSQNLYVEILTLCTSECDLVWK